MESMQGENYILHVNVLMTKLKSHYPPQVLLFTLTSFNAC